MMAQHLAPFGTPKDELGTTVIGHLVIRLRLIWTFIHRVLLSGAKYND